MLERVVLYFKTDGVKGIIYHFNNFLRRCLTPAYMTIKEMTIKPENKIVFCNFAGKGYGGYPKCICDELIKRNSDAELVWLVNEHYDFPDKVRTVNINSYAALRELATAKVWIDNCRKAYNIRKGKRQFYLQTWHDGGPGLKKAEGDAEEYLSESYIKDAKNDSKMADLFISDCKQQDDNYRRAFWYHGEILNCTTPPNDSFYQDWDEIKSKVCDSLHIDHGKHIVLYAPTFRNNRNVKCYDLDYIRILRELRNRFGGEWTFVIRLHPTMSEKQSEIYFNASIINGTQYPQIEDLIIASDVFITDFSSSMFLAFRWKINCFLYASDYESYLKNERPLYFDIEELPATLSRSNDELIQNIRGHLKEKYNAKCQSFSTGVGFYKGGHSVKTITDRIEAELHKR